MIDRLLSTQSQVILEQALRASGLTHEVIAHNLANVNTPGFKRSEVIFQDKLAVALSELEGGQTKLTRTHASHLPGGEGSSLREVDPEVVVRAETSLRPDGNNVDLDSEIVKLSQNQLLYRSLTQILRMKLAQLRTVINEGRR
jgi:flagellar basal-body rod protein FlgB